MTHPTEVDPWSDDDSADFEEYDGPVIPFDLFGRLLELRRDNTCLMRYVEGEGEFDHVLHVQKTSTGIQPMNFFLKELDPEVRHQLIFTLEELDFPITSLDELDDLVIARYADMEASTDTELNNAA